MSRLHVVLLAALLLGLALPLAGAAQEDPEASDSISGYAEFRAGFGLMAEGDITGPGLSSGVQYDEGFLVGGALGVRLPFEVVALRAELDVGYQESQVNEADNVGRGTGEIGILSTMVNLLVDYPLDEATGLDVTPYLGAGIGFAYVDSDWNIGTTLIVQEETIQLAWNAMAGFYFPLNEWIDLNLGYRYLGMTDVENDTTYLTAPVEADLELSTHQGYLGVHVPF